MPPIAQEERRLAFTVCISMSTGCTMILDSVFKRTLQEITNTNKEFIFFLRLYHIPRKGSYPFTFAIRIMFDLKGRERTKMKWKGADVDGLTEEGRLVKSL